MGAKKRETISLPSSTLAIAKAIAKEEGKTIEAIISRSLKTEKTICEAFKDGAEEIWSVNKHAIDPDDEEEYQKYVTIIKR